MLPFLIHIHSTSLQDGNNVFPLFVVIIHIVCDLLQVAWNVYPTITVLLMSLRINLSKL